MIKVFLFILCFFIFKAGRAINKFDISENIGHSHKQRKEQVYDWSNWRLYGYYDSNRVRVLVLLELIEQQPSPKKFKLETPMGSLESDSGNHLIDVFSIVFVILLLYLGKKIIDKK